MTADCAAPVAASLDIDIEWDNAPFDVAMFDDYIVAVDFDSLRGHVEQILQQGFRKAAGDETGDIRRIARRPGVPRDRACRPDHTWPSRLCGLSPWGS